MKSHWARDLHTKKRVCDWNTVPGLSQQPWVAVAETLWHVDFPSGINAWAAGILIAKCRAAHLDGEQRIATEETAARA